MNFLVEGKPRNGKSYFLTYKTLLYLCESDRHFYSNIPIKPDAMAEYVWKHRYDCHFNRGGILRDIFSRVHFFHKFSLQGGKDFIRENPNWNAERKRINIEYRQAKWRLDLCTDKEEIKKLRNIVKFYQINALLRSMDVISEFWIYCKRNSVIMIDEVYNYFSALDYKDKSRDSFRRQLLTFSRQHGHLSMDVYLISHSESDIDKHLREGVSYYYECFNSKYKPLVPLEIIQKRPFLLGWLRPWKHFRFFFIVEGRPSSEKVFMHDWRLFPDPEIFNCYHSHSDPENLLGIVNEKRNDNEQSSDINQSTFQMVRESLVLAIPHLVILGVVFFAVFQTYSHIKKLMSKDDVADTEVVNVENKVSEQEKKIFKIVGVSSNSIIYDDGFKLKKGDKYHDAIIEKIGKNECVVSVSGKSYRIGTDKVRFD